MRFSLSRAALFALTALLGGCNLIFGLDEVSQAGEGGSGGDKNTSSVGSGGGGGGGGGAGGSIACPEPEVPGELVVNGSFENDGAWQVKVSDGGSLEYVPAESCDFACGERVARMSGTAPAGQGGTFSITQDIPVLIEMGGLLELSAHYRYTAMDAPYFEVIGNGYNVGSGYIKGMPKDGMLVLDALPLPVDDPRRTGDHLRFNVVHAVGGGSAEMLMDCLSLRYTPPPGEELLKNGWFELNTTSWTVAEPAMLAHDSSHGKCGIGGGLVEVPPQGEGAVSTTVTGSWPAGTSFDFAGAAGPPDFNSTLNVAVTIVLRLDYTDDSMMSTDDFIEKKVPVLPSSEPWRMAKGKLTAEREVKSITLRVEADNSSSVQAEKFMADCFTVRAAP